MMLRRNQYMDPIKPHFVVAVAYYPIMIRGADEIRMINLLSVFQLIYGNIRQKKPPTTYGGTV